MAWSLLHADTFNRADGSLEGSTMSDGVGAWSSPSATTWTIATNRGKCTNGSDPGPIYDTMAAVADQKSEATRQHSDTGVVVRRQAGGAESYYYMLYGGTAIIYKYSGSFTNLASSGSVSNGDVIALEAIGSTLNSYINGVFQTTASDSTYATGACGMYGGGSNASEYDDFASYVDAGGSTTRGAPFGSRGTAFNGGRTFMGILR